MVLSSTLKVSSRFVPTKVSKLAIERASEPTLATLAVVLIDTPNVVVKVEKSKVSFPSTASRVTPLGSDWIFTISSFGVNLRISMPFIYSILFLKTCRQSQP